MANTFKNARAAATNTLVTVYTAPSGAATDIAIVLLAQATNVGSGAQAVDLCWYDASGGVKTDLVKALSVPEKAAVGLIAGKLVLESGDYLQVKSTASSLIELSVSVLEITWSVTGIAAGKTWSRIGPEVAPTSDAASGVWLINEVAENLGAGTWPAPVESAFEFLSSLTADGSTGTFSFTSLPQTYKTLRLVINARDTSTQYRPTIRLNNDSSSNYRVANLIAENATYSAYTATSLSGLNLNPFPINNHPYTMSVDFPGYYSANMVSPALFWFGQSDQTTGGGASPMNVGSGGLFNGSAAITRIDVVALSSNNLGASSTISLFGIAA